MTTAPVRVGAALAGAGVLLGMLTACTPEPEPKPTKTALFASDEEAYAAAEETYRAYTDAYESLDLNDPRAYEATLPFVTGSYATEERKSLSELRAQGISRRGNSELIFFRGVSFEPLGEVHALACNDVTAIDVVDAAGRSVVSPDRPDKYALELTFLPDDGDLKLANTQAVEDTTCD